MKTTQKTQEAPGLKKARAAKATVKYLRIAPRKMRGVINTIRHKHPETAFVILSALNKKAARMVEKILKTAVANAKVLGLDEARLTISDVRADGGPVMKRFMERSMGRGNRILKRTTHLSMTISEGQRTFKLDQETAAKAESLESPKAGKAEKASKAKKTAKSGKAAAAKA